MTDIRALNAAVDQIDEPKAKDVPVILLSAEVQRVTDRQGKRQRVEFRPSAAHKAATFRRMKG